MRTLVRFVGTGRCSCNQSSCHAFLDSWPGLGADLEISFRLGPGPARTNAGLGLSLGLRPGLGWTLALAWAQHWLGVRFRS